MNAAAPELSVVIPFLDEEARLPKCLAALRAQTYPAERFEVILVDNGSRDRSCEVARAFHPAALLAEPVRDPYLARNRGIAAARGRHLVFLDADCIAAPDWLATFAPVLSQVNAPPVVLGYIAYPDGVSWMLRFHETYYHTKLEYLIERNLHRYYFGHAGNMAVRADVFREVGPFLPMPLVGDSEIIHRVTARWPSSPSLGYLPAARVVHDEVTGFGIFLHKQYECGAYSRDLAAASGYRMLPRGENWRIFSRARSHERLGFGGSLAGIAALGAGFASFECGRFFRRTLRRNAAAKASAE